MLNSKFLYLMQNESHFTAWKCLILAIENRLRVAKLGLHSYFREFLGLLPQFSQLRNVQS